MLSNEINTEIPYNFLKEYDNNEKTIVAVLDSKINEEHDFLKYSFIDGEKFISEKSNEEGHGTAVAGAVLKYSDMTAKEFGTESNVVLLPVEINVADVQNDHGYLLGQAIQYAVDSGADVINMSFSSASPNLHVYEKIRYGLEKGVIFVSAAGNSGYDAYSYPAAYEGVISAGSCNISEGVYLKSSFSNSNDDVDLLVEGENLLLPDEWGYSEKTGTSYSAGALSGIIGELICMYPEINPEHIAYALYDTATPVEGKGTGYGAVNIEKAVNYLNDINKKGISPTSYKDSNKLEPSIVLMSCINDASAGRSHITYVDNGIVKIYGNDGFSRTGTVNWKNIIKAYAGGDNTAAIDSNNLPMAAGYNVFNKNIFRGWTNIKDLSLSSNFTAGLTYGGSVLVTDYLKDKAAGNFKNIIQITSGAHHIAALTDTGKVLTSGYDLYNQMDTEEWENIVCISSNTRNTAAVDNKGNAFAAGDNLYGQCDLNEWKNIVSIAVGDGFIVGLKSDGTVTAKGRNIYGVCETKNLKDIKYIDASDTYFIAADKDNNVFIKGRMK